MAKKKAGGVNKAAKIREYLQSHPSAAGVEVVKALAAEGIKVAPAQVSNIKTAAKKNGGRKAGSKGKKPNGISTHGIVAAIGAARTLIEAAGSAYDAKAIIDILNGNMVGNG